MDEKRHWINTDERTPPEEVPVWCKLGRRRIVEKLCFLRGNWLTREGSYYLYKKPTHWLES